MFNYFSILINFTACIFEDFSQQTNKQYVEKLIKYTNTKTIKLTQKTVIKNRIKIITNEKLAIT